MDTADRIFELVDARYKDQKDFAVDIGVTPSQVSKWRGHISKSYVKYLSKIAMVLDTTTDYLVTGEGPKERKQILVAYDFVGATPLPPGAGTVRDDNQREKSGQEDTHVMGDVSAGKASLREDLLKAAFFEGGEDLTQEEMDELWEDAKDYIQYKLEQRRRRKDGQ